MAWSLEESGDTKSAATLMKLWATINDRLRSQVVATKGMHVASPIFLRDFP